MRLAGLLGKSIVDRSGRDLGAIHDVRLVKDGPSIGSFGASYRLHSLLAGTPSLGVRLGLDRDEVKGPWPITAFFRRLHADIVVAHWDEVWSIEEEVVRLRSTLPAGERELGLEDRSAGGTFLDAGLQLLDRQIIDSDGRMAGKVDDLLAEFSDEPNTAPSVVSILSGPGALAPRIGGRLGTWIAGVYGRIADEPHPNEISFGVVKRIDNHVELILPRDELGIMGLEEWAWNKVISKIPGNEVSHPDAEPR
jgi:sporulation protein YlmC with PRC-barrel domain